MCQKIYPSLLYVLTHLYVFLKIKSTRLDGWRLSDYLKIRTAWLVQDRRHVLCAKENL